MTRESLGSLCSTNEELVEQKRVLKHVECAQGEDLVESRGEVIERTY